MGTTQYAYSTFQCWFLFIYSFLGVPVFDYGILHTFSISNLLLQILVILASLCVLGYLFFKYLLRMLQGKPALVLDEEKMEFFIDKKTVYWKELKGVKYAVHTKGGWDIVFFPKNGDKRIAMVDVVRDVIKQKSLLLLLTTSF